MSAHGSDAVRFDVSSGSTSSPGEQGAPRRPRRRPGENRERLLAAGISVFGIHGYHGAQTAAIAALAEVPQPHVYANFTTKQELFLACAERVCDSLIASPIALNQVDSNHADSNDALNGDAENENSVLGAFLLQCIAATAETKLQPALDELLQHLGSQLGERRVLELIMASARLTLRKSQGPVAHPRVPPRRATRAGNQLS